VAGLIASSATPPLDPAAAAMFDSGGGVGPAISPEKALRAGLLGASGLALVAAIGLSLRLFRRGRRTTTF